MHILNQFNSMQQRAFALFAKRYKLTSEQTEQCKTYLMLLLLWNQRFNITTITDVKEALVYHFEDSLTLGRAMDLEGVTGLLDVGTGGGFPGLPLKICYPNLPVFLLEVNKKKIKFLEEVVSQLGLQNVDIIDMDWRTFLRKTNLEVNAVCARASLDPEELSRMFKPASPYKDATLIYWASAQWKWRPMSKEPVMRVGRQVPYVLGTKSRKLVFFTRA